MNILLAEEVTNLAEAAKNYEFTKIFAAGGPLMWALLVLSVIAFMVIFICSWTTRASAVLPKDMVVDVEGYIRRKDYAGVLSFCERNGSSFARTVNVIILFIQRNHRSNMEAIREVAAAEGTRQANILSRQISWLADIGAIAPMVGLLGTVLGMMETFWQMASGNFEGVKQMQMAGGISEALITTAGGLMLAIPCMLAYVIFRNYIQKHISDMEVAVTHVLSVIAAQSERDSRLGTISHVGARPEMMDGDEI